MSYHQDDGKKPVYRKPTGSNWLFLGWPPELVPLIKLLMAAWRAR